MTLRAKRLLIAHWITRIALLIIPGTFPYVAPENTSGQRISSETYPLQKRAFILSITYSVINNYFAHWQDVPDLNLDAVYQSYLEKGLRTEGRYEFDLLMMEFISHLRNGHSWFRDAWLYRTLGQPLGFNVRFLGGKWVITESDSPEIKAGDAIEKINGEDFDAFYQRNKIYTNLASDQSSHASFPTLRFLFPPSPVLELSSGSSVKLNRTQIVKKKSPEIEGHWITAGSLAYLKVPHFANPQVEDQAIALVQQFKGSRALIIDLRGYAGGLTPDNLIATLMDRPYRSWAEGTNINYGLFQYYNQLVASEKDKLRKQELEDLKTIGSYFRHSMIMWPATTHEPEKTIFRGKLILLIDGDCYSAKEDFIMPFKDNHRAVLIGERTAGSSGQPFFYNFDEDLNLAIGTKREYFPDGSRFEGIGIAPDIEVVPTIADIKAHHDPVIERAISLAGVH